MRPRVFTGVGRAPRRPVGWNSDELHGHIRGRADATVQILIGVAALRSSNALPASTVISVTGARWQDWSGSTEQPRAHRFPCNPQINGRDLPDLSTGPLRELFEGALSITDPLYVHVNYADQLFEDHGGIEAARQGVETLIARQRPGAPVSYAAVNDVWRQIVWAGYVEAWEEVGRTLTSRINTENAMKLARRIANPRPNAPTHNIETVMDVAYDARRSTKLVSQPGLLTVPGFESVLQQLGVRGDFVS